MGKKPTQKEVKQFRDRLLQEMALGKNIATGQQSRHKIGDVVRINDVEKTYKIERVLARMALQRLCDDVRPAVLNRIRSGTYGVLRVPGDPAPQKPSSAKDTNRTDPGYLQLGSELTVVENPFGGDGTDDVYFVQDDQTGEFYIARMKMIKIPQV